MGKQHLQSRLLGILFPRKCISCGEILPDNRAFCDECGSTIPADIPVFKNQNTLCVFPYEGPVKNATLRLKKYRDKDACTFFAWQMQLAIDTTWPEITFDAIVPVPSSKKQLREKGFNHAELLARELGSLMDLPIWTRALCRSNSSQVQHYLKVQAREINAQKSFSPSRHIPGHGNVILVDDVYTTGATARVCSHILLEAGCKSVYVVTSAKAYQQTKGR